ncbi:MAG: tryptophan 7-halogenase [Acidobacteriota bacterium]|nr:tryptophan 7-halogenase [Acidobacteriota bacterium]
MREVDVLIVGAGPAGATAALNLAPIRRVAVIDRRAEPPSRIGESIPPAVRRLLTDMGLFESFLAEEHAPCHANRSVWGGEEPRETDFLRDPDGHGWHLDRRRFECWLRGVAADCGAELLVPDSVERVERHDGRWRVESASGVISAAVLIDAGGRAAPLARKLGARVVVEDRLVCAWTSGVDRCKGARGMTFVEAAEDGWWYTAPLPNERRVLAFHTDSDLPMARGGDALLARAVAQKELAGVLRESGFVADTAIAVTAANSATLEPCAGDGWLAAGDAALAFDPLSSQGILNALFTGLAAAEAADRFLSGESFDDYAETIAGIRSAYRAHLHTWYGMERRWPDTPFWQRRQSPTHAGAST